MILSNDFQRQWSDVRQDVLRATEQFGARGWYVLGDSVRQFEASLASYWQRQHVIGVASGLDAIEISLKILGCKPGDRVLTSPISAFATVLAIVKLGAVPVFVDCDRFGLIDLAACRDLLEHESTIRYFVPVHLYGHALDLAELTRLRDDFDLQIVEDCAQSIGSGSGGKATGSVGQIGATSFYPTKNLGALGDGGAIFTDSAEMAAQARMLRDYGQCSKYVHGTIGYNSRLDEIQAAFMNEAFLPRLDRWIESRRDIARRYCNAISNPHVIVPGHPSASASSWHLFPVIIAAEKKSGFRGHLERNGVQTGEHYPLALVEQPAIRTIRPDTQKDCANARQFCHGEVSLPIHPYLSDEEVSHVIAAVNCWNV